MLIYLAKNNNNESIQTVSVEDKRKECEFCNNLCQRMELEGFKTKCQGKKNKIETSSLGAKINMTRWNYFLQWASWIHRPWQRCRKAEATLSFVTSVLPQVLRWLVTDRFSIKFIYWTSMKTHFFKCDKNKRPLNLYKLYFHMSPLLIFSNKACSLWGMSCSQKNSWQQRGQQSKVIIWMLPVST
jgi:hypothetical protein